MWGADPEQLKGLGAKLSAQPAVIEQIITAGNTVNDVPWEGPAKTAFVAQWGEFVKSLLLLHQAFTQAGAECTNRAAGLEQVMGTASAAV
jgi:hypothetical protein